ncbi:hypothetical protein M422DRAFT_194394, partial [Sphaerobolus stellatus SS14]
IIQFQCLYLKYCSLEDWHEKKDILHCNPNFYGEPQYDCIVINTNPISFGQLQGIFTYKGENQKCCTVALVSAFQTSKWNPKTRWEGCQVFEEKGYHFILLKYVLRGCHMIPVLNNNGKLFYLNDLIDGDTFLQFFLEEWLDTV